MSPRLIALFIMVTLYGVVQYGLSPSDAPPSGMLALSMGAVILAGYLLGELLSSIKLPRISGYLLAGMLMGPFCTGVLSFDLKEDVALIDQIALALIALSAGGDLHIHTIRKRIKGIAWITLCQTLFVFAFGTLTFFLLIRFLPYLAPLPLWSRLSAASIFGVIAVAQSPATTIAVIKETDSTGTAADLLLGVAVIKDVVVIVFFTLLLPFVKLVEHGGQFEYGFILGLGSELLISFGAGIIAGWVITFYLKYIKVDSILFILAFCFLVSEGSKTLHLDNLIVCIVAGFWTANFSLQGKKLLDMIENSSLIIYVIFFCITGAYLDLNALQAAWMLTIVLVIARMVSVAFATTIGLRLSDEKIAAPNSYWMAFLPQAGVSLGLLSILQQENIPWGYELQSIVVATIALNQMIGPITMKLALNRCAVGEQ